MATGHSSEGIDVNPCSLFAKGGDRSIYLYFFQSRHAKLDKKWQTWRYGVKLMSDPVNPSDRVRTDWHGIGVNDRDLGTILQRGGEELILLKLGDRFTASPADPEAPRTWIERVGATPVKRVPNTPLEEFTTDPDNLERAMQQARDLPEIAFVSHVYRVENNPGSWVYLTDELTIQFAQDVDTERVAAIVAAVGVQVQRPLTGIPNTFICKVSRDATENPVKIANRLMRDEGVLTAEPNISIASVHHYQPKDPLYSQQWYLFNRGGSALSPEAHIDIEKAWDITRGIRSVVVAVADDSIDLNHPDFQGPGKIVAPRDFKDRDFLPLPEQQSDNHGTGCAGVAVAEETGAGVVGVAPGCALMPLRTTGYLDDDAIEQLFDWAIQKGAAVISCSWGPSAVYFPLSLRQRAVITRAATEGRNGKGCVIVFAAGNANRPIDGTVNERGWPKDVLSGPTQWLNGFAIHPDAIAVSASTSLNKKAAYSNWGKSICVCAPSNNAPPGMWLPETGPVATPPEIRHSMPGLGVFTTDRVGMAGYDQTDYTGYFGGTSSACPVVAGVAALVLSVNPDLTAAQVKQILQQSADKIVDRDTDPQLGHCLGCYDDDGHSDWFGYGKVNAYKAVRTARRLFAQSFAGTRQVHGQNNRRVEIPDGVSGQERGFSLNWFGDRDRAGVTSEIAIDENSVVRDLRVRVAIEHSFAGDLELYLTAPDGQTVQLQDRTLGNPGKVDRLYSLETTPTLRKLCNRSAKGVWKLWAIDCVPGDTGWIDRWELTLTV